MKHSGKTLQTIVLCVGCVLIAAFTKDSCIPAAVLLVGILFIWSQD